MQIDLTCISCGANLEDSLCYLTMVPYFQDLDFNATWDQEWGDGEYVYEAEEEVERPYYCHECREAVTDDQHAYIESVRNNRHGSE